MHELKLQCESRKASTSPVAFFAPIILARVMPSRFVDRIKETNEPKSAISRRRGPIKVSV